MRSIVKKALAAAKESKHIEFKSSFDVNSQQDWRENIKDFVALANSGGGIMVYGLNNDGMPSGADIDPILKLDPATIANEIDAYTNCQFADFEMLKLTKSETELVAFLIGPAKVPIAFTKPGTYPTQGGKQTTAFSRGTVYFRHGAKSEPGTTEDLRQAIDRRLQEIRKEWIDGVQKVVAAPIGSSVSVLPPEIRQSRSPLATPIRIVDDPSAPAYRVVDPNQTHIYRQSDVAEELHKRLPVDITVKPYDVFAVRRVYGIDAQEKYFFKPKFGSPQYSVEFVEWLEERGKENPGFFIMTREQLRKKE